MTSILVIKCGCTLSLGATCFDTIDWKIFHSNNLNEKFVMFYLWGCHEHSWLQYSTMYQHLVILLLERARYNWPYHCGYHEYSH